MMKTLAMIFPDGSFRKAAMVRSGTIASAIFSRKAVR